MRDEGTGGGEQPRGVVKFSGGALALTLVSFTDTMDDEFRLLSDNNPCRKREIIIMVRKMRIKAAVMTAMLSAAIALGTPAAAFTAFAATGTVTSDSVNVRSDADTSSSIVGTASNGDQLQLGDSKTDATGNTWYQVTLGDGSTGYIRSDFLNVDDSSDGTSDESDENGGDATTEAPEASSDGSTEAAAAGQSSDPNATEELGGYQIVLAPDTDGTNTYFLYNNNTSERMKLSDIDSLQQETKDAQSKASSIRTKYRAVVIALAALLLVAVIGIIVLILRLRDAMGNGRFERDLVNERRAARSRDGSADDLSRLRREGNDRGRAVRSRQDAYASGSARRARGGNDLDEDVKTRPGREERRQEGYTRVRTSDRMGRDTRRGYDEGAQNADGMRESSARRPERAARAERPEYEDRPLRQGRPVRQERDSYAQQRPERDPYAQQRPVNRSARPTAQVPSQRNAGSADDDDFDYDFLNFDGDDQ